MRARRTVWYGHAVPGYPWAMSTDPEELADQLEREAEQMQRESERLGHEVSEASQDWQRKRSDPNVPGAPPGDEPDGGEPPSSPAPQAPPPEEGPSGAQTGPDER
jgi:hypothetical protein